MKNPFTNETVKSAAIVVGSAVAFIALSKGVTALRKKLGLKDKGQKGGKALFESAEAGEKNQCLNVASRNDCVGKARDTDSVECCEAACRCEH